MRGCRWRTSPGFPSEEAGCAAYTPAVADGADETGGELLARAERRGPVTFVTLDSPHNRNALSRRLVAQLAGALAEARDDPDVRAVVLTGTGTAFCSGVDLAERRSPAPAEPGAPTLPDVLSAIVSSPHPVVARVNGHVRAGGMGLVAACDFAVAPSSATFAFTEVRVGVAPAVIAVPALRRMARRAFERYALTGEVFGAEEAAAAGLLHEAVDDLDALDAWVADLLSSLLRCAPGAVAATKGLADLAERGWPDALETAAELSEMLFASAAASEGMAAFLEKRDPEWVAPWPPTAAGTAAPE